MLLNQIDENLVSNIVFTSELYKTESLFTKSEELTDLPRSFFTTVYHLEAVKSSL